MKVARIGALSVAFFVGGGFAFAAAPKPVKTLDRVTTSQSRGLYAFRKTKYNKVSWGARWHQTLGRAPVVSTPYVTGR